MCPLFFLAHSMDFEYLNQVPVLTIDVNEDFKGNEIKSADMIEKVSDNRCISEGSCTYCAKNLKCVCWVRICELCSVVSLILRHMSTHPNGSEA